MARQYNRTTSDPTQRIHKLLDAIAEFEASQLAIAEMVARAAPQLLQKLPFTQTPEAVIREREYQRIRGKYNEANRDRMRLSRLRTERGHYVPYTKGWQNRDHDAQEAIDELCGTPTPPDPQQEMTPISSPGLTECSKLGDSRHTSGLSFGEELSGIDSIGTTFATRSTGSEPGSKLDPDNVDLTAVKEAVLETSIDPAAAAEIQRLIDEGKV